MIEFKDTGFSYDGTTLALDSINLHISQGEFVCVLGGNGSGKSTLAKHMNALLIPDTGCVVVQGYNTHDRQAISSIRNNVGMVFQNPDDQLVANLVENDVAFGPENLGVPTNELQKRVADALGGVGLQGFEKRETATLSGGQKQRVAIAGVLAMNPSILVLDEATAMLDPRGRKGLMRVCHQLHESGMTIVMITHYMEEAAQAERIIILEDGHVACDGTPQDILIKADLLEHLNLDVPFSAALSFALKQRGVPINTCIGIEVLKEELCALFSKA